MRASIQSMQGLSMIEVLVTTLLLALGLLGTSALQVTGLKGTDAAHYRTVATLLSQEVAERIRMNPDGVSAGNYATDPDNPVSCSGNLASFPDCTAEVCDASQLAEFDKFQMTCGYLYGSDTDIRLRTGGVKNELPNGSLSISCGALVCGENIDHTITVSWRERADIVGQEVEDSSVVLTITP